MKMQIKDEAKKAGHDYFISCLSYIKIKQKATIAFNLKKYRCF